MLEQINRREEEEEILPTTLPLAIRIGFWDDDDRQDEQRDTLLDACRVEPPTIRRASMILGK